MWVLGDWSCLRRTAPWGQRPCKFIMEWSVPLHFSICSSLVSWSQGGGVLPCRDIFKFLRLLSHRTPADSFDLVQGPRLEDREFGLLGEPPMQLWLNFCLTCCSPPSGNHPLLKYPLPFPYRASDGLYYGLNAVLPKVIC